ASTRVQSRSRTMDIPPPRFFFSDVGRGGLLCAHCVPSIPYPASDFLLREQGPTSACHVCCAALSHARPSGLCGHICVGSKPCCGCVATTGRQRARFRIPPCEGRD